MTTYTVYLFVSSTEETGSHVVIISIAGDAKDAGVNACLYALRFLDAGTYVCPEFITDGERITRWRDSDGGFDPEDYDERPTYAGSIIASTFK